MWCLAAQRKKDMNASKNPNSLIIQKLAQLVRDVTVTVWSHKPKSKKSTANVDLSKMCAEIKRKYVIRGTALWLLPLLCWRT